MSSYSTQLQIVSDALSRTSELEAENKTLKSTLVEKDLLINELNKNNSKLAEKDAIISENNLLIATRDALLTKQEAENKTLKSTLVEKDLRINELNKNNSKLAEKDAIIATKDAIIATKDAIIATKDALLTKQEAENKTIKSTLVEKDLRINELNKNNPKLHSMGVGFSYRVKHR